MTRKAFLVAGTIWCLRADDASDIWDLFTEMASALSDGKAAEFMQGCDRNMAGYDDLRRNIAALLLVYEVHSSIELVSEERDGAMHSVELDWFLQIVEKQDTASVTRRRQIIRCRLVKEKKKWRITAFEPVAFFAPPNPPA